MAKLIYSAIASLDGYIEDRRGRIDWAAPDDEVHAFVNDLERPAATYLYGRRMYETMRFWETAGTSADDELGGAILNAGTLMVRDSVLSSNSAFVGLGGGIYNGGILTVIDCTLSDNSASLGSGGGIYNNSFGEVTVKGSLLSDNLAGGGGGIENSGTLTYAFESLAAVSVVPWSLAVAYHVETSITAISRQMNGTPKQ